MSLKRSAQSGFSMVELMVAMVVTLIISGAIYGLLAGGQNAFRREPALTDRQQQIRAAMDIVQRDLANAGQKMGTWFQTFTRDCYVGVPCNGAGPVGPSGDRADFLEMFGNDGTCPDVLGDQGACPGPHCVYSGSNVNTAVPMPSCYPDPGMLLVLFPGGVTKWGWNHNTHGFNSMMAVFPPGQQPPRSEINNPNDLKTPAPPIGIGLLQYVRYEIVNEPGTTDPALYRSTTAGVDVTGTYQPAPNAAGGWQLLARGIEDMQVRYTMADGTMADEPATVVQDDFTTITREVRVTFSARALAANLGTAGGGLTTSAVGSAVRGQLTSVTTPRAVLYTLQCGTAPAFGVTCNPAAVPVALQWR